MPVFAQPAGAVELDAMVVTPSRDEAALGQAARAVSVIGMPRIQRGTQQLSLDEALAGVPGLYLQNRYNFAQDLRVSLRGFGARANFGIRGIRIMVDGIPQTLPDGQAGVDSIDLGSAQRIEVLRGPAASLYGNASGGVIAVTSELGASPSYLQARLAGGAHGYAQWQLKSAGELGGSDYLVNLSRTRLAGYREHSRARGELLNAKWGRDLGNSGRLTLALNLSDQPEARDPGGISAEQAAQRPRSASSRNLQFDAGEQLQQQKFGAVYRHAAGFGDLTLRAHSVWRDFSNLLPFEGGGAVDLERYFGGAGLQFAVTGLPAGSGLTLGLDHDRQDDRRKRFDNLDGQRGALVFKQDEEVQSTGLFAQARYAFAERWMLRAGLRHDRVEYDVRDRFRDDGDDSGRLRFDALSPALAVSRTLGAGTVYASYSSGFETPTTTELANPDASGGFNPDLQPQSADNYEVGWKWRRGPVAGELALFAIDLDDELVPFELEDFPGRTFYANAGASSRRGAESAMSWQLSRHMLVDVAYTWSEFEFDRFVNDAGTDFRGKRQPGVPEHFAHLSLNYADPVGWSARIEANYSGTLFADNANTVAVAAYTLVNARLSREFRLAGLRLRPYLGINNLFDEDYFSNVRNNAFGGRYFEPAPGRNGYAGVEIRWLSEA